MRRPARVLSPATTSPSRDGEAGFTIIEVLVAALIVVLLGVAVATALVTQTQASTDEQTRSQAELLVNQNQDRLRGMSDQALSTMVGQGASSRTVSATGTNFTVASTVYYQTASGQSSCASTAIDYFRIDTQVTWSASYGGSSDTASADSLLTRPVTGVLETTVNNQLGAPLNGVSVTATPTGTTGGSGQTGTTDASGCSAFAGLAGGTYTVSVSDAGYVNNQNQSQPSSNVTVSSTGSTTPASFVLGLAGSIAATFTASASNATPSYPGQADALTYAGVSATASPVSSRQPTSAVAPPSTTLLAFFFIVSSTTSLYPWFSGSSSSPSYTGNYTAYAGACSFQNPFPAGSATTNLATVPPGTAASATIQEPFLYLGSVFSLSNLQQVTPRDIVLTYSSGGCTDQYSASIATSPTVVGQNGSGVYLGVTYGQAVPTNGWLADPGQPYAPAGDLTVCVDESFNGAIYDGTATVANTNMSGENVVPPIAINFVIPASCPGITS